MSDQSDTHVELCLTLERLALLLRYGVYLIVFVLFVGGLIHGSWTDLVVVTIVVGVHNAFAHTLFLTGRTDLFFTRINFAVYFLQTCLVVLFTGAETSEAYVLYYILILGCSAYTPRFSKVFAAGLLCCAGFAAVLAIEWWSAGIDTPAGQVAVKFLFLLIATWITASLSGRLNRIELAFLKRAEDLAASEATLRAILDSVDDPLVVCDQGEFITDANERACEILAATKEKIVGRRFRSFLFDDGTLPQKVAALRTRGAGKGQEVLLDMDGSERTVDYTVRSFYREGKRYYVAIFHDVSPQKDLEETARLANLQLERLTRELQQVNQLKTSFWTTVSHRLRSPLTAVLGHIEMLIEEELGDVTTEQRKALHACRRAVLRCFQFINEAGVLPGNVRTDSSALKTEDGAAAPGSNPRDLDHSS